MQRSESVGLKLTKIRQISPALRISWPYIVDVLFPCVLCSEAAFAVYLYLIRRENMPKLVGIGEPAIA